MKKTAVIIGASGLVGGLCLEFLLADTNYDRVLATVRRPLPLEHPKLVQEIVNFDDLEPSSGIFLGDDLFCCLGTTIKKAGSRENFIRVDRDYTVEAAKIALRNGMKRVLVVTALGANPASRIFYNRVKGETEAALGALPFEAVHYFRPSLLLGNRSEFRLGEKIGGAVMRVLSFLMMGPLSNYRAIDARDVARAMVTAAGSGARGVIIHESGEMRRG